MALEDEENIAIFHFNNICLSPVIFASRCVCHVLSRCRFFTQLLPTLDIYTWTEEHVVRISPSPLIHLSFPSRPIDSTDSLPFVCLFYFLSISGCSRYLAQVRSIFY